MGGVLGLKEFKAAPVVLVPVAGTLLTWFHTHYQLRDIASVGVLVTDAEDQTPFVDVEQRSFYPHKVRRKKREALSHLVTAV
jgi:hypothetical protein